MSAAAAAVVLPSGICVPSHYAIPAQRAGSFVRAVEGVAGKLRLTLDPTQRFAADVLTSARADGRPATLGAAIICPRQNLKTFILELITLSRLLRPGGDSLAVWSAHEVSTAQETFLRMVGWYEAEDPDTGLALYPWFRNHVHAINRSTGREFITFKRRGKNGKWEFARLKFKARIKSGGRGLAGDLVILDEAFALVASHMGSLLPILSTRRNGLIMYGSSHPHADSLVLHDVVRRGRAGLMAYAEWGAPGSLAAPGCLIPRCTHAPGVTGCVFDDLALVRAANPRAYHGGITQEYLLGERQELSALPAEYARERLGWPEEPAVGGITISVAAWEARIDPGSEPAGRRALALDIAPDRGSASIGGAGWRADGTKHLALIEHAPGTSWAVRRLVALAKKHRAVAVVVDGASPAGSEIPALVRAGLRLRTKEDPTGTLVVLGAVEMGRACAGLWDATAGDAPDAWHRGDTIVTDALRGAARRKIGDGGWAFGRSTSETDISPIVSIAEALHGLVVTPAEHAPMGRWGK